MANSNRSQVYLDANDGITRVIDNIANSVNRLNGQLGQLGQNNQNGLSQVNSSLGRIHGTLQNIGPAIANTIVRFAGMATAVLGVKVATEGLYELFKEGLKINMDTETTKIGIAGLVATLYDFKKGTQEITGMDKLNTSLVLTESIMKRLRISAIETGASFDEVVEGYRNAVGGGARLGIDPIRLEKLSTMFANAAKGFGLDKGQTGQETRAVFTGKIDNTATIGKNLGLGPGGAYQKEYKAALKKGGEDFAKFLEERLEQFSNAGKVYADSVSGIFDQIGDSYKLFKGDISKGLTEEFKDLKPIADSIFKGGDFTDKLDGLIASLQTIGKIVGENLVEAFKSVIDTIFNISEYLAGDQTLINGIIEGAGMIGETFGIIFGIVGDVFNLIGDIVTSFASLFGVTVEEGKELDGIQLTVKIITGAIGAMNVALGLVKDTVHFLADAIRKVLGVAIDFVMDKFIDFVGVIGRISSRLGLDNVASDLDAFAKKVTSNKEKAIADIVGVNNRLNNVPDTFGAKVSNLFQDTVKALDKSASAFEKANSRENKTVKKYLDDIKKNRENAGKENPLLNGVKFSSNAKGDGDEKGKKGKDAVTYAYEQQLKELERLAQKANDLNDSQAKYLELYHSNNLVELKAYFEQKNKLSEEDYNTQVGFIEKELELIAKEREHAKKKKDLKELNQLDDKENQLLNKKAKLQQEYAYNSIKNYYDQIKAVRDYQNALKDLDAQILEMSGDKGGARKIRLEIETENLKEKYKNDPEALAKIDNLTRLKQVQEQFNSIQENFNLLLDQQSVKEERINILGQNGRLTELEQLVQLGDVRKQYVNQLADQIDKLQKVYDATKNPDTLVAIDKLKNKMLELQLTVDPLALKFDQLFTNSLGDAFASFIDGTKSASEAFKDFARSIEKELLNLASKQAIKELAGLFGINTSGGSGGFGSLVSSIFGGSGGGSTVVAGGNISNVSGGGMGSILGSIGSWIGGFFASGGIYNGKSPVLVGEGGPEIFYPGQSGYIANAPLSQSIMNNNNRGFGGGIIQNINITTPNAVSFKNSDGQIGAQMLNAVNRARRYT